MLLYLVLREEAVRVGVSWRTVATGRLALGHQVRNYPQALVHKGLLRQLHRVRSKTEKETADVS